MYKKDWVETASLVQLFVQTFQHEYQPDNELGDILLQMSNELHKTHVSEETAQLLMTIHHIHPKATMHAYQQITNLNLYNQKYPLNLLQITMTDILTRNIKTTFFDF